MSRGFVVTLYGREECRVHYSYQICRRLCVRHLKVMLDMWRTNRNSAIKGELKVEFCRRGFFVSFLINMTGFPPVMEAYRVNMLA